MGEESKIHYLAQDHVKRVAIRKRGWRQPVIIHLETVEISPVICCFECEDGMMFNIGDELDFSFDLGKNLFMARAVIQRIDRSEFLDELYDQKPMFCCCAQFSNELAREIFDQLIGTRLITRPLA
jgi:hypothetical protein